MKSIQKCYVMIQFGLLLIINTSCSDEEVKDLNASQQDISFHFQSFDQSPSLRQNEHKPTPYLLVLSIEKASGEVVHEYSKIPVYPFGDSHVSNPIQLNEGEYQLSVFHVLDEEGRVIYSAPLEGSFMSELVENPLPIDFYVSSDMPSKINVQVVPVNEGDDPGKFGYLGLSFDVLDYFFVDLNVMSDWDSTSIYPEVIINSYSADSSLLDCRILDLDDSSGWIIGEEVAYYEITATEPGYHSVTHFVHADFLRNQKELSILLSTMDSMQQFKLTSEYFGLNPVYLYIPIDGCIAYSRMDLTGLFSTAPEAIHYVSFWYTFYSDDPAFEFQDQALASIQKANVVFQPYGGLTMSFTDFCLEVTTEFPDVDFGLELFATVSQLEQEDWAVFYAGWTSVDETWEIFSEN